MAHSCPCNLLLGGYSGARYNDNNSGYDRQYRGGGRGGRGYGRGGYGGSDDGYGGGGNNYNTGGGYGGRGVYSTAWILKNLCWYFFGDLSTFLLSASFSWCLGLYVIID